MTTLHWVFVWIGVFAFLWVFRQITKSAQRNKEDSTMSYWRDHPEEYKRWKKELEGGEKK